MCMQMCAGKLRRYLNHSSDLSGPLVSLVHTGFKLEEFQTSFKKIFSAGIYHEMANLKRAIMRFKRLSFKIQFIWSVVISVVLV